MAANGNSAKSGDSRSLHASSPEHVIVIAGSAGALAPLRQVIRTLGSELRAAVVVTIHSPPDQPTLLAQILSRDTSLPVKVAAPGELLRPGHVYVAPPGYHHVVLVDGRIQLRPHPRRALRGTSGDPLLISAASNFGSRAIGVVLSGSNRNGAAGLRAIRAAGGLGLAQDPGEATFATIPLAAIADGVDLCASAAGLGHYLVEACGH
jgi:two-component system chemotaxis response regulator CheB